MVAECPGLPHDGVLNFTLTLTGNVTGPIKAYRETQFKGQDYLHYWGPQVVDHNGHGGTFVNTVSFVALRKPNGQS